MQPIRFFVMVVTVALLLSCDDNENKTIVVPGEISISPAAGPVCAGNAIQFTCTYDTTIGDIEWKVIGPGTITASGHYYLPDTLGTDSTIIRVVAHYKKYPDVSDTATLIGYTKMIRTFVTELTGYSAYRLPFIRPHRVTILLPAHSKSGDRIFYLNGLTAWGELNRLSVPVREADRTSLNMPHMIMPLQETF